MDALVERLMEELNCETVFTIPVFGGIPVSEAVVVTCTELKRRASEAWTVIVRGGCERVLQFLLRYFRRARKGIYPLPDVCGNLHSNRKSDWNLGI